MIRANLMRILGNSRLHVAALVLVAMTAALGVVLAYGQEVAWADDAAASQKELTTAPEESDAAMPAKVAPIEDGDYFIRPTMIKRKVVGVAGGGSKAGSNVDLSTWSSSKAQKWHFSYNEEGEYYTITVKSSGKALTAVATKKGANVCVKAAKDSVGQRWVLQKRGSGYLIKSAADPKLVLDVAGSKKADGTNVRLYDANGAKGQKYAISPLGAKAEPSSASIEEGVYLLKNVASGKMVEVKDGSRAGGANVRQNRRTGSYSQRFWIEKTDNGYYRIINLASGLALYVENSDILPGANVEQHAVKSIGAELWSASKNKDGSYTFTCRKGGNVLEVAGGSKKNGANVRTNVGNGTKAQRFKLVKSDLLNEGIVTLRGVFAMGKVVDLPGAKKASGTQMQMYKSNDTRAQKFFVTKVGEGRYTLRSCVSAKYLAINSKGKVIQQGKKFVFEPAYASKGKRRGLIFANLSGTKAMTASGSGQSAKLVAGPATSKKSRMFLPETVPLLANGYYVLQSGTGSRVLDISGGSYSAGANAQIYTANESEAQVFYLKHTGNGYYRIINAGSSKHLAIANGSKKNGANVRQETKAKDPSQLWKAEFSSDASVTFTNKKSGKLLSVAKNKDKDYGNVIARKRDNKAGQRWVLTETEKPTWETIARSRAYSRIYWKGSSTNYLVAVDLSYHYVMVYWNDHGTWKLWRSMQCTNGAWKTPTVTGDFAIGSKGYSFSGPAADYTCYYWTQFYGDYLFHSVLYYYQSNTIREGRLGMALSHGCIRLDINDAKWLQDHIPSGTRVYVYNN